MRYSWSSFLVLFLALSIPVFSQSSLPQAYTLRAELAAKPQPLTLTIYRDGQRELLESGGAQGSGKTLVDFAAHKVYWIDLFKKGTCSAGRYLSSRAPVSVDFITGTSDVLGRLLPPGSKRTVIGKDKINGIPATVEQIEIPAQNSSNPGSPTKIWIAEQGGYLVKIEVRGEDGRPDTMYEVKQLTFSKPSPELLTPPANCEMTNSEMDDSGQIHMH